MQHGNFPVGVGLVAAVSFLTVSALASSPAASGDPDDLVRVLRNAFRGAALHCGAAAADVPISVNKP